ncbi:MAG: AmmeMemoRadiSam system protein A [Candidatus Acidiferrales bacterium]
MLPLTAADQQVLLRIARRALEERIQLRSLPPPGQLPAALERPCGAFVTLHHAGSLRGCIGRFEASAPLHQTVYECAVSAALNDPRFDPVEAHEVPELRIEISVLSPLLDARPEEIEIGLHGIFVSQGARQGLLLPQVAVERGWDRIRFLEQTCLKARLDKDAWRRGARVQTFTAQVFAEGEESVSQKGSL